MNIRSGYLWPKARRKEIVLLGLRENSSLGERVKHRRDILGIGALEVGIACGVTAEAIRRIEKGGRRPKSKTLGRLIAWLEESGG